VLAWTLNFYDAYGNLTITRQVRDAATLAGPTVTYTYDASGLAVTQVQRAADKDGDKFIDLAEVDTASLVHDGLGRLVQGISADWYPRSFAYDAVDRVVSFTDALGKARTWGYDANGNKVLETLPGVDRWSAAYDLSDRKVAMQNTAGFPTTYQYDAAGNVIAVTNPDGFTLGFEYDASNRVIRAVDQEGLSVARSRTRTATRRDSSTGARTSTDGCG
jgi:YD repeat-containing protein